jgi:predicted methyltransferase
MKTIILAFAATVLGVSVCEAQQPVPSKIAAAISDPARGSDKNIDARRHPAELLAFAGIKPGDTVVDLIPGSGYFTKLFSLAVGPKGHVIAIWPTEYANEDTEEVGDMLTAMKDKRYANVRVLFQPAAAFAIPGNADEVWTSQNYHDYPDKFMGPTDPNILDRAVFKALKSGGTFVVVDHVAEAGSGTRDTDTLHRIDPAVVKTQVAAAGFKLDGESDVLRNPQDSHKIKVFDAPIRGHTDQFAFRFRKPH